MRNPKEWLRRATSIFFSPKSQSSDRKILFFILLLAVFLRIYKLDLLELFGDELDVGYQSYSILKTGEDIRGNKFPLYFHSFSESRAPFYLYSAVPFVAVFGLNPWGVRLPAVFFGLLNILFLYLLVKKILNHRLAAILAAFIVSTLPWHLHYSRASFEVTLLLFLVLAGILFFLDGLEKPRRLVFSSLFFALSVYTYSTAVVFTPLLILLLCILYFPQLKKLGIRKLIFPFAALMLVMIPFLFGIISGQSQERFSRISVFTDKKLIEKVIQLRSYDKPSGRIFHNKLTIIADRVIRNYFQAFSPEFLFLRGDPNPRHSVIGSGELLIIFFPFVILGLFMILKNFKGKPYQFLFYWLLISPLPSILTSDGGDHATRLFLMIPPLAIIIGLGFSKIFERRFVKLLPVIFLFFIFEFVSYFHLYYFHYPKDSWQYWSYGYQNIFQDFDQIDDRYEKVIFNNSHEPILIRFLFWTKKDPGWFLSVFNDDKPVKNLLPGFDGFKTGKYYFGSFNQKGQLDQLMDKDTVYLAFQKDDIPGDWDWQKNPPEGIKVLKMVTNPLGEPYIYLITKDDE